MHRTRARRAGGGRALTSYMQDCRVMTYVHAGIVPLGCRARLLARIMVVVLVDRDSGCGSSNSSSGNSVAEAVAPALV